MHAILRDLDLRGAPAQIAALARVHARLLDAPAEEAEAAAAAVEAAWAHPLLERARAAARCHRELPIPLRLEDGRLLEGVIDLAFIEQDRWVIVDFKSDAASFRPLRTPVAVVSLCTGEAYGSRGVSAIYSTSEAKFYRNQLIT